LWELPLASPIHVILPNWCTKLVPHWSVLVAKPQVNDDNLNKVANEFSLKAMGVRGCATLLGTIAALKTTA